MHAHGSSRRLTKTTSKRRITPHAIAKATPTGAMVLCVRSHTIFPRCRDHICVQSVPHRLMRYPAVPSHSQSLRGSSYGTAARLDQAAGTHPTLQLLSASIRTTALLHMRTILLASGLPRSAICMQRSKRVSTTQHTSPSPMVPTHMRIPKHNIGCMVVRHVWNQVHIPLKTPCQARCENCRCWPSRSRMPTHSRWCAHL